MRTRRFAMGAALAAATMVTTVGAAEPANPATAITQDLARRSPVVQSAMRLLVANTRRIRDPELRRQTLELLQAPRPCVRHRAKLTQADRGAIVARLVAEGLADPADEQKFPGGLVAAVFPPLDDDGGDCPTPPQPFFAAPGSAGRGEHHGYPGGLAVHEAFVQLGADRLGDGYRRLYGATGPDGFPAFHAPPAVVPAEASTLVDPDLLLATPVWHDCTKTFVSTFEPDGSISREAHFGGNGKTDDGGKPGNSKAHAHHVLGIAEAIARGLRADLVVTLAASHGVPYAGNEYLVVNWIRAAAIIARVDPVARGLLYRDAEGRWRLAPVRVPGNRAVLGETLARSHMLAEYALHQLGDGDWTFTNEAAKQADDLLARLAPELGYDPADRARYELAYRLPALAYLTSERLAIVFGTRGLAGVRNELAKLRRRKLL